MSRGRVGLSLTAVLTISFQPVLAQQTPIQWILESSASSSGNLITSPKWIVDENKNTNKQFNQLPYWRGDGSQVEQAITYVQWEPVTDELTRSDPREPLATDATSPKSKQPLPPYTWPNGQPMNAEDKKFYSTAYSRGSLIQIGETIYPNLGFNALQRSPSHWGNISISAIDNTFLYYGSASDCPRGNFTTNCADALLEVNARIWNSKEFSFDLQWTLHSLSGEGFNFAGRTGGTAFGEGQSLGFRVAKNFAPTLGIALGANRLFHLDQTTDLTKNLYLMATKILRVSNRSDSPIISMSFGVMTDIYNPLTNIGVMQYPDFLLGGMYPSLFAEYFDKSTLPPSQRGYYPNVAGVTSQFVCAGESIYIGKPISTANSNCIKQVSFGPVGSIGIAPWPWLGFYAIYEGNVNLGISVKPVKDIPLSISVNLVQPFSGINKFEDDYIELYPCAGQDLNSCRTRIGLYVDWSF